MSRLLQLIEIMLPGLEARQIRDQADLAQAVGPCHLDRRAREYRFDSVPAGATH